MANSSIDRELARIAKQQQDIAQQVTAKDDEEELPPIPPRGERTAEDADIIADRAKRKAELIQVLSRGEVSHSIEAVMNRYADETWVPILIEDSEQEISRARALGAVPVVDHEQTDTPHGTGDGFVRIGDVVVFKVNRRDKEILDEIQRETVLKKSSIPREDYVTNTQGDEKYVRTYDNTQRNVKYGG